MLRVIIYHPKEFSGFKRIHRKCKVLMRRYHKLMIVCNDEKLSHEYISPGTFIRYRVFEPEWNKYPNDAGFRTRCLMGRNADALIAYYDGKDSATKQMIAIAQRLELKVKVIDI